MDKTTIFICNESMEKGISWASLFIKKNMYAVVKNYNDRAILNYVQTEHPDVLILDADFPDMDIVALVSQIRVIDNFTPLIFVTSKFESCAFESRIMAAGADFFFPMGLPPEVFVEYVVKSIVRANKFTAVKDSISNLLDIECEVTEIIHQVGIPAHIKGYHYLRKAIILAIEDDDMINNVTKLLYPTVATEYNTTASRVERAIRHAIEIAWDRGNVDVLNGYFGYTIRVEKGKPTNSEFIALIADKLKMEIKKNMTSNMH